MGLLGMAMPVVPNINNFRHPVYDLAKTALAGPAVNAGLALAGAAGFGILTAAGIGGLAAKAVGVFVSLNVLLAMVNLVPLYPMDGKHLLSAALHAVHPGLRTGLDKLYDALGILGAVPLFFLFVTFRESLVLKVDAVSGALLAAASAAFGFLFS
jgi:Zn-dependent protease